MEIDEHLKYSLYVVTPKCSSMFGLADGIVLASNSILHPERENHMLVDVHLTISCKKYEKKTKGNYLINRAAMYILYCPTAGAQEIPKTNKCFSDANPRSFLQTLLAA